MKKIVKVLAMPIILAACLTSCAAGAATAGYSLKAQAADSLTTCAERRLIEQAKAEMRQEMGCPNQ